MKNMKTVDNIDDLSKLRCSKCGGETKGKFYAKGEEVGRQEEGYGKSLYKLNEFIELDNVGFEKEQKIISNLDKLSKERADKSEKGSLERMVYWMVHCRTGLYRKITIPIIAKEGHIDITCKFCGFNWQVKSK